MHFCLVLFFSLPRAKARGAIARLEWNRRRHAPAMWKKSSIAATITAAAALFGAQILSVTDANAQHGRKHPPRRTPAPAPAPSPSPAPQRPPGSGPAADPGVRSGSVDAGAMLDASLLTPGMGLADLFEAGADAFADLNSVLGTIAGESDAGLGPRFNSNGCGTCHAQPALGGTSPSTKHYPFLGPNPQVALATAHGATNKVPYFIAADGPVREARFKFVVENGRLTKTPDGGVHQLYTIQGRTDATNVRGPSGNMQTCRLAQPDFDQARRLDNVSLRIPTPTFGLGLIENISDATIVANMRANAQAKAALGIAGRPNRNGNDGTIAKFGWKAQNASLMVFAAEAYNVEQGVTNEGRLCRGAQQPGRRRTAGRLLLQHDAGRPLYRNRARRRRAVRRLHAPAGAAETLGHAAGRGRVDPARRADVHQHRLRALPYAHAHRVLLDLRRGLWIEADRLVLRLAAARHGPGSRRRHLARRSGPERVPHGSPLGTRPARVFPA